MISSFPEPSSQPILPRPSASSIAYIKPTHAKAPMRGHAFQAPLLPYVTVACSTRSTRRTVFSLTQVMGDAAREAPVIHGLCQQGGGTQGDGGDWVSGTTGSPPGMMSSGSSSLFSSTSSLTDDDGRDDATSSPPARRHVSSLTSSDKMHTDGAAAGGPLYELSKMLDHLPSLRPGLSKFYRGRSQSFTSLAEVSCVEDLAKKTTPYIRRTKASRCYVTALGAQNQLSKKIAKKVQRSSPDRLLSKVRGTSLLRSSAKPPAYHGKREVYRC